MASTTKAGYKPNQWQSGNRHSNENPWPAFRIALTRRAIENMTRFLHRCHVCLGPAPNQTHRMAIYRYSINASNYSRAAIYVVESSPWKLSATARLSIWTVNIVPIATSILTSRHSTNRPPTDEYEKKNESTHPYSLYIQYIRSDSSSFLVCRWLANRSVAADAAGCTQAN